MQCERQRRGWQHPPVRSRFEVVAPLRVSNVPADGAWHRARVALVEAHFFDRQTVCDGNTVVNADGRHFAAIARVAEIQREAMAAHAEISKEQRCEEYTHVGAHLALHIRNENSPSRTAAEPQDLMLEQASEFKERVIERVHFPLVFAFGDRVGWRDAVEVND